MARDTTGMIPFQIVSSLPFVSGVEIFVNGRSTVLDKVLVDTGSAGTIFSAERMLVLGVKPTVEDRLIVITGIGGIEYAFSKAVDSVRVGPLSVSDFEVEIGAMDYGFEVEGIIGMNFLLATKAKLDCDRLMLMS